MNAASGGDAALGDPSWLMPLSRGVHTAPRVHGTTGVMPPCGDAALGALPARGGLMTPRGWCCPGGLIPPWGQCCPGVR